MAQANWLQAEAELEQDQRASLLTVMPPFIELSKGGKSEAAVNATGLFRRYLRLGQFHKRLIRSFCWAAVYLGLLIVVVSSIGETPMNFAVRGHYSHLFDSWALGLALLSVLLTAFYVLDSAYLTKRFLNHLIGHPTCWPEPALRKSSEKFNVAQSHLDGFLDMEFAAVQTQEIRPLLFGPLLLILAMLIARSPCFDAWTWPSGLIVAFIMNFLVVTFCWSLVRSAAETVRQESLKCLNQIQLSVKTSAGASVRVSMPTDSQPNRVVTLKKEVYLENLETVRQKIEAERRGAFARWFQDPTYLAVFIPSGITGIISLISTYWLTK